MKILIVDDNTAIVSLYKLYFNKEGHECFGANSIKQAKEIIKENEIDAAIVDINLGGESGEDFIKYLKEVNPLIFIIVITGIHYFSMQEIAKKYGIACMQKPAQAEDILKILLESKF